MNPARIVLALAALAVAAYLAWRFWPRPEPPPPPAPPVVQAPQPAEPKGPQYPLPAAPEEKPLPKLGDSDATALESLTSLMGSPTLQKLVRAEGVVRRIVATVDNLPREQYAERLSPLHPVPGRFATRGKEGERTIAPENERRYEQHLRTLEKLEPARVAEAYRRLYPLFQEAYVELGYPGGYFNDRLVFVIDHLLQAPETATAYRVEAPKAMFEYADPDEEARSSGHKVMMRMGGANAKRVKAWLRAFRAEIVQAPAAPR
jgi:hypothetical protein